MFMTYGGAIFVLMPLVIVGAGWVLRRSGSFAKVTTATVVGAVTMALTVTFIWFAAGFWWFDGAEATEFEYWVGMASSASGTTSFLPISWLHSSLPARRPSLASRNCATSGSGSSSTVRSPQ
jgi:predicted permease